MDPTFAIIVVNNVHAGIAIRVIVPYLCKGLFGSSERNGLRLPDQYSILLNKDNYGLYWGTQMLLLSAVQITGDLRRSFSLDNPDHMELIKVLR